LPKGKGENNIQEENKMSRKQLEKTYGITIADDSFVNPMNGRYVKAYKMYSADGCVWEKGLRTLAAIKEECETWKEQLLNIKRIKEVAR
jgi:hypothetical protein